MKDANFLYYLLAFALTFLITVILERRLIPILKATAAQPIYTEGPDWHMKKSGTPTMGGIGFLISCAVSLILAASYLLFKGESYFALSLIISLCYAMMNSFIGIIDDRAKIRKKENAGLSPIEKLMLQAIAATMFLLARNILLGDGTTVYFSTGTLDLGMLYYPIALLMLLGTVNCANLTDGVDGIASGVAFAIGLSLAYLSLNSNSEVEFISFAIMGAAIAFLIFNIHPAKIFMGDTGSLLFGSLIAAACFSLGNMLIILVVGIIYVIEGLSVVLQVAAFKMTGKRIFRMAPFHHHLEKCGWSENKIVIWAIIVTVLLSAFADFLFL
ncbi:MAG: phospho-N-acetylmuramoyl-pentapeptide-transferase [Ruminococcaceae bacterium]|nr:phospho-N-acetylmuramoyl-pentapeptide-transferase [Oscillospiraceae bacterium]